MLKSSKHNSFVCVIIWRFCVVKSYQVMSLLKVFSSYNRKLSMQLKFRKKNLYVFAFQYSYQTIRTTLTQWILRCTYTFLSLNTNCPLTFDMYKNTFHQLHLWIEGGVDVDKNAPIDTHKRWMLNFLLLQINVHYYLYPFKSGWNPYSHSMCTSGNMSEAL